MSKKRFPKFESQVDRLDLENEQLIIKSKNLCAMIEGNDFVDSIFYTLLNKKPSEVEKKILNASLVSFHAGFQAYPPTILFPRIAASLGAGVSQSLAAGYCASGPLHTGAIESAMYQYLYLRDEVNGEELYEGIREIVKGRLEEHCKLYGFGHPLFVKDPRPETLRGFVSGLGFESDYLTIYDAIRDEIYEQKDKNPNIDGINSAILLSLGFEPEHGVGLFLMSRTIGMLAHVVEESKRPSWEAWKSLVGRGLLDNLEGEEDESL